MPDRNKFGLNGHVNQETYDFVESKVKEIGPPLTKSGVAAFIIQTFAKEAFKMPREIIDFCQRREDRKNRVVEAIKENIQKREEKSKTDDMLQQITSMLHYVIEDNKSLKNELNNLKKELGC